MEIIFEPEAGKIYSIFTSLFLGWNVNILENQLEMFGVDFREELKEEYYYIKMLQNSKKEQMDFFFNSESEIFRFFIIFEEIWECKSIDRYVNLIENMSNYSLRIMLVKTLIDNKLKNDDKHIEVIASSEENILDFIKKLDISKSSKWDLYCFLDGIEKYKGEFINLIKDYVPTFNKLFNKQKAVINKVNNTMINGINSNGIDFVKEYTNNFISLNGFKRIYITNSYFDSYLIYFTLRNNTEDCYLVIGPYYKEVVKQNDYMETYLKILKNLSEKTRFGIMKYILGEERYGQEIADKFNISNASVSYHMNNLLILNLVKISKKDNKVFYKFNKEKILETIKFLEKELEL
ncbi:DNA-binding transcriptional ArsR family regulator [Clostridium punense]|uniref:DNA-binding transcriptional ArsR family regulator n=1 Tax=Clostridium punense TaxID=1054297 RepID=A0ABS4K6A4_9CLOT|nr:MULTISPECIES: helix-turn-helix transcriptional regulator [Clostridium]EQB90382.1 hypothetical protein M918_00020 [Clostridium sp. BL8]MBP2023312.1 DNA-binding transcriptional ArsR family regulator [Clostridium punense]